METNNKEHMDRLMTMYARLPDTSMTDNRLYDELIDTLNKNDNLDNGHILNSLKLIIIQLCESCVKDAEDDDYSNIQEKYK